MNEGGWQDIRLMYMCKVVLQYIAIAFASHTQGWLLHAYETYSLVYSLATNLFEYTLIPAGCMC